MKGYIYNYFFFILTTIKKTYPFPEMGRGKRNETQRFWYSATSLPSTMHVVCTKGEVTEDSRRSIHGENALFTLGNSEPCPGMVVRQTDPVSF